MTKPTARTLERERGKLFVTDAELIRRLGMPEKVVRQRLRELDGDQDSGFPAKNGLFGNRRYWPAVEAWFASEHAALPDVSTEPAEPGEPKPELIGKVYFLASPTHVKIGFSSAGVRKRIRSLSTGHYEELELLDVIALVPRRLERALHKKFAAFRVSRKKEWFRRVPEIEEFIRNRGLGHWRKELLP